MTVAMGVEALNTTAREKGIDLEQSKLGAVGATGNICSLYAQMMAEVVPRMVLIGRPHMEARLRRVAGKRALVLGKVEGRNPAFSVECRIGAVVPIPMAAEKRQPYPEAAVQLIESRWVWRRSMSRRPSICSPTRLSPPLSGSQTRSAALATR